MSASCVEVLGGGAANVSAYAEMSDGCRSILDVVTAAEIINAGATGRASAALLVAASSAMMASCAC